VYRISEVGVEVSQAFVTDLLPNGTDIWHTVNTLVQTQTVAGERREYWGIRKHEPGRE